MRSEEEEQHYFESSASDGWSTTEPSVTFEHTINQCANENPLDCNNAAFEAEMMHLEEMKLQNQRENEINAAIRCLATNLVLCMAFILVTLAASTLNQIQVVVITSLLKTFVPIIATISNFVKIHTLLMETFLNCKNIIFNQLNDGRMLG